MATVADMNSNFNIFFHEHGRKPGFTQIDNIYFELGEKLTHGEFRFLMLAMRYVGLIAAGKEPPTYATLADKMGVSLRQIMRIATSLEDKGYIGIITRMSVKGDHTSNAIAIFNLDENGDPMIPPGYVVRTKADRTSKKKDVDEEIVATNDQELSTSNEGGVNDDTTPNDKPDSTPPDMDDRTNILIPSSLNTSSFKESNNINSILDSPVDKSVTEQVLKAKAALDKFKKSKGETNDARRKQKREIHSPSQSSERELPNSVPSKREGKSASRNRHFR